MIRKLFKLAKPLTHFETISLIDFDVSRKSKINLEVLVQTQKSKLVELASSSDP